LLFGSIIIYSLANIANAFVYDVNTYAIFRFLAGLGLAGELGGCITLVSELLPRNVRGYGTCLLSAIGVLGAVLAGEVAQLCDWRTAYIIGGVLGLLLLFLRVSVQESKLFAKHNSTNPPTFAGQLACIFLSPKRLLRYIACILIGLPCWYVIGILVAYSPEIAKELGTSAPVKASLAIMFCYSGISVGDIISGVACQVFGSRKKVLLIFMVASLVVSNGLLLLSSPNIYLFYGVVFMLGITAGYWAVFATVAAEHFGTNIRATIATTVPNFCRGSLTPLLGLYTYLKPSWGAVHGSMAIGALISLLAFIGWLGLRETFHDDLDYREE
jgi:MFS family permease